MTDRFYSPTHGVVTFKEMVSHILNFTNSDPESSYKIMIGSDSQTGKRATAFVTVVVVHKVGKGACFFYTKDIVRKISSLRHRIWEEVTRSTTLASEVAEAFVVAPPEPLEVHIDVGNNGKTKPLIKEVVAMVNGSGFVAKIKPDAFAAASVADCFTKAAVASIHQDRLVRKEQRIAKSN